MTIVFAIGLFVELLFIIRLEYKVCANESGIFGIDGRVDRLAHDIKGSEDAIKVLSDSVRKLNGVVKDREQKKPKIEPKNRMNTRAFIAGWDADEPELIQQLIPKEEAIQIIKANLNNCQRIEPLPQQCIYPWQPLQSGQFQSSAMSPLWYINRRLEDM